MNSSNVSLQSRRFSKQVEDFCQNILKKSSVVSQDECQDLIGTLIQTLVAIENHLKDSQEAELKVRWDQFVWQFLPLLYLLDRSSVCPEDPAEAAVVGGADWPSAVPACIASTGSLPQTEPASEPAGAADEWWRLGLLWHGKDSLWGSGNAERESSTVHRW